MDKIIIPIPITNKFIREHDDYIFIYGYDVAAKGALGACVVCIGEPNCFPVPVRFKGCKSSGYFQDTQFLEIKIGIDASIEVIKEQLIQLDPLIEKQFKVIPFPKIGRGASRMFEFAPKCYKYLMDELNKIKYPNIEYKYGT